MQMQMVNRVERGAVKGKAAVRRQRWYGSVTNREPRRSSSERGMRESRSNGCVQDPMCHVSHVLQELQSFRSLKHTGAELVDMCPWDDKEV